jgi:hypothetical protein
MYPILLGLAVLPERFAEAFGAALLFLRPLSPVHRQLFATDRPWRVWHGLARAEYAALDQLANGFGAYIKDLRGLTDSDYSIAVAFRTERRDAVVIAQRVDP